MSLHLRQQPPPPPSVEPDQFSPRAAVYGMPHRPISSFLLGRAGLLAVLSLLVLLGILLPWSGPMAALFSSSSSHLGAAHGSLSRWKDYTLAQAAAFAARNRTVVVCAVSRPYLPFLKNWLISVARQKRQDQVIVIAEDYATLYEVNRRWPGHAVLVPPASDSQTAHKFGSQVLVKPLNHPHDLPPPGKKGRTYICSCMIFLHPTRGAKEVMRSWIEELQNQPWSVKKKSNDQPAFNWALNKTAGQVIYLIPYLC
ncbi:hypothetical protein BHM03_00049024 [Ensete ventricosum]|nr:hypothetical protein BHM03_00049024 [Ensete ventricosum]